MGDPKISRFFSFSRPIFRSFVSWSCGLSARPRSTQSVLSGFSGVILCEPRGFTQRRGAQCHFGDASPAGRGVREEGRSGGEEVWENTYRDTNTHKQTSKHKHKGRQRALSSFSFEPPPPAHYGPLPKKKVSEDFFWKKAPIVELFASFGVQPQSRGLGFWGLGFGTGFGEAPGARLPPEKKKSLTFFLGRS